MHVIASRLSKDVYMQAHLRSLFIWFLCSFFSACGCDVHGTIGNGCNALTGKCPCKRFVKGEKCDKCFVSGEMVKRIISLYDLGAVKNVGKAYPPGEGDCVIILVWSIGRFGLIIRLLLTTQSSSFCISSWIHVVCLKYRLHVLLSPHSMRVCSTAQL